MKFGKVLLKYDIFKKKDGKKHFVETKTFLAPHDTQFYVMEGSKIIRMTAREIMLEYKNHHTFFELKGYDCVADGSYTYHEITGACLEQEKLSDFDAMKSTYTIARHHANSLLTGYLKYMLKHNDDVWEIRQDKVNGVISFYNKEERIIENSEIENLNGYEDLRVFLFFFGTDLNVMTYVDYSGDDLTILKKEV